MASAEPSGATCYEVVGWSCAVRSKPSLKSEPIGDIPQGQSVWGLPLDVDGTAWVRLVEEDARHFVPAKEERSNGCWVIPEHPAKGRLLRASGQGGGQAAVGSGALDGRHVCTRQLRLKVRNVYESALELEWCVAAAGAGTGAADVDTSVPSPVTVELVAGAGRPGASLPHEASVVRRLRVGAGSAVTAHGLQAGEDFLVAVAAGEGAGQLRSGWLRASTLTVESRDGQASQLQGLDPTGQARGTCTRCSCEGYVPVSRRSDAISAFFNCRRCACHADCHNAVQLRARTASEEARMLRLVEEQEAARLRAEEEEARARGKLREFELAARERLARPVCALPREAVDWDERERYLWFFSHGMLHPREHRHAGRRRRSVLQGRDKEEWEAKAAAALSSQAPTCPGKASVVTPTTESRQKFHKQLWSNFTKQTWSEKELIVIETYEGSPSKFFSQLDGKDDRLVFLSFKVDRQRDLPIGAKRNLGQHMAVGDYIVNFDDDDLYAPTYITTMLTQLEVRRADLITLSSWYVIDMDVGQIALCDPFAHAKLEGKSWKCEQIDSWIWGYGFSYVHRLDPVLEAGINYPEENMSEDLAFFKSLRRFCGEDRAALLQDERGICLHVLHGGNQSASFCVHEVQRDCLVHLAVGEQALELLPACPRLARQSRFIHFPSRAAEGESC